MNFYQSALISLAVFTAIFYYHWNRFDQLIDESKFARFLAFGILTGIVYGFLFSYLYIFDFYSAFVIVFSTLLLFPVIESGAILSIISGKHRKEKNLPILSTAIGGGMALPQIFFYSILLSTSFLDVLFSISLSITAIFSNMISSYLIGNGISHGRMIIYYNASIITQFLVGFTLVSDYLFGRYSIFISISLSAFSAIIYMLIFNRYNNEME